jgi:hypothetical protein
VAPLVVAGGMPWPQARALIESAIGIYESAGDEPGAALARLMMSLSAFFNGEIGEARRLVEDVRKRYEHLEHPLVRARTLTYLGAALSFTPHGLEEGQRLLRQGAGRSGEIGDRWGTGLALTLLGLAELRAGHRGPAREHLSQALKTAMQGGVTATAVGGLGQLAGGSDPRRALTLLEGAVVIRERAGVPQLPVQVQRQLDRALVTACQRMTRQMASRSRACARAMTTGTRRTGCSLTCRWTGIGPTTRCTSSSTRPDGPPSSCPSPMAVADRTVLRR